MEENSGQTGGNEKDNANEPAALILSWSAGPGSSLKGTVFLVAAIVNVWGEKNHLSTMCRALLSSCSSSSIK